MAPRVLVAPEPLEYLRAEFGRGWIPITDTYKATREFEHVTFTAFRLLVALMGPEGPVVDIRAPLGYTVAKRWAKVDDHGVVANGSMQLRIVLPATPFCIVGYGPPLTSKILFSAHSSKALFRRISRKRETILGKPFATLGHGRERIGSCQRYQAQLREGTSCEAELVDYVVYGPKHDERLGRELSAVHMVFRLHSLFKTTGKVERVDGDVEVHVPALHWKNTRLREPSVSAAELGTSPELVETLLRLFLRGSEPSSRVTANFWNISYEKIRGNLRAFVRWTGPILLHLDSPKLEHDFELCLSLQHLSTQSTPMGFRLQTGCNLGGSLGKAVTFQQEDLPIDLDKAMEEAIERARASRTSTSATFASASLLPEHLRLLNEPGKGETLRKAIMMWQIHQGDAPGVDIFIPVLIDEEAPLPRPSSAQTARVFPRTTGGKGAGKGGALKGTKNGKPTMDVDSIDFNKKILHASWHPRENTIAIAATNNLFLYSQAQASQTAANALP